MSGAAVVRTSPPPTPDLRALLQPPAASTSAPPASSSALQPPGTPVTSTPAAAFALPDASVDLGSAESGRRHLQRLLRLSRSGNSVVSSGGVTTPASLSMRLGETMTPLPQTPMPWSGYANATPGVTPGMTPGVFTTGTQSDGSNGSNTPEETTPLYQRFGLTQSSENSSVMSASLFSQSSQSLVLLDDDDEEVESDLTFDLQHGANAVDLDSDRDDDEEEFLNRMESPQRQNESSSFSNDMLAMGGPRGGEESADLGTAPGFAFSGSSSFVEALLGRATKRRRAYIDDASRTSPDAEESLTAKRRWFWTQCDTRNPLRLDHITLMNRDISNSGHRALTILGCDASVHTKAQISAAMRQDPSAASHWAAYFPICELQHVWSKLVSSMYFWGDRFATSASVRLVTASPAVRYAQSQLNARKGATKELAGFDTILRMVQHGDISEDELLCCAIVPCSNDATLGEIRRTGVALMASLPGDYRDRPVHFRRGSCCVESQNSARSLQNIPTEDDHMCESTFRMCRERIALSYQRMSALGTVCGEKRKRDHGEGLPEGEDRKDFVLYKLSGIVWKVCKDTVSESLWSKPQEATCV